MEPRVGGKRLADNDEVRAGGQPPLAPLDPNREDRCSAGRSELRLGGQPLAATLHPVLHPKLVSPSSDEARSGGRLPLGPLEPNRVDRCSVGRSELRLGGQPLAATLNRVVHPKLVSPSLALDPPNQTRLRLAVSSLAVALVAAFVRPRILASRGSRNPGLGVSHL